MCRPCFDRSVSLLGRDQMHHLARWVLEVFSLVTKCSHILGREGGSRCFTAVQCAATFIRLTCTFMNYSNIFHHGEEERVWSCRGVFLVCYNIGGGGGKLLQNGNSLLTIHVVITRTKAEHQYIRWNFTIWHDVKTYDTHTHTHNMKHSVWPTWLQAMLFLKESCKTCWLPWP